MRADEMVTRGGGLGRSRGRRAGIVINTVNILVFLGCFLWTIAVINHFLIGF